MPSIYGMNGNCYGRGDYYRGDYYRGDYYRGDPGLLGSLFKGVVGGVKGLITGGPTGAVTGALGAVLKPKQPGPQAMALQGTALAPGGLPVLQQPFQPGIGIQTGGVRFGAFGPALPPGPVGTMEPGQFGQFLPGLCGMKGTHTNKAGYFKRVPGQPLAGVYVPKGTVCVKNRSMNPTNGRALRRALRRAESFKRIALRTIRLVDPKRKAKAFAGFKGRKKRA